LWLPSFIVNGGTRMKEQKKKKSEIRVRFSFTKK